MTHCNPPSQICLHVVRQLSSLLSPLSQYLSPIISPIYHGAASARTGGVVQVVAMCGDLWHSSHHHRKPQLASPMFVVSRAPGPGVGSGSQSPPVLLTSPASSPAHIPPQDCVNPCEADTDLLTKYNLLIEPVRLFQLFLPDISVISNI